MSSVLNCKVEAIEYCFILNIQRSTLFNTKHSYQIVVNFLLLLSF